MATLNSVMKAIADAIREKTGKSELIAPVDFAEEIKGISAGGGSGESGEKAGMTYVKKEALFDALETPMPETMPQAELRSTLLAIFSIFPPSGMKKTSGLIQPYGKIIGEEIDESRFTFEKWEATSIDWDAIQTTNDGNIPTWKVLSQELGTSTVEEFKVFIKQIFPNQLTEEEFFGK
jgi:hypothetical protein